MSTLAPRIELPRNFEARCASRGFHLFMASACFIIAIISAFGCKLMEIQSNIARIAIGFVTMGAMVSPLLIYWDRKGQILLRDCALTVIWGSLLANILPSTVLIAARFRRPLQDAVFVSIDRSLGVSVPAIAE